MLHSFSFNKTYFDPSKTALKNNKGEVILDTANFAPKGKSWTQVTNEIGKLDPSACKLIFVTRHANSHHNVASDKYKKALYYRFFAGDAKYMDPALTEVGEDQARKAGQLLKASGAPLPDSFYSSPLRRCVVTGMLFAQQLGKSQIPTLHVKDELREWLGWDHNHTSDKRSKKSQILQLSDPNMMKITADPSFPEDDRIFEAPTVREAFVDVDQRIRAALDSIFESDSNRYISLFLHNRCLRSFLRVIGHKPGVDDFDMANASTIAFLVTRKKLAPAEALARNLAEQDLKVEEILAIKAEKGALWTEAKKQVKEMPESQYQSILKNDLNHLSAKAQDWVQCRRE
jgi:broad specificity phosphatase PhoE